MAYSFQKFEYPLYITLGTTSILLVHLLFYAIPLSIYDVIYDITTTFLQLLTNYVANAEMFYELTLTLIRLLILLSIFLFVLR